MKISEVVRPNETAEFAQDVQLRWYAEDGAKNLALVRRYVFSRTSAGERKSPIDILYQIKQASLLDTYENRFVVIATFGHGKTHLALALANFFGKRPESEEVDAVLNNIRFAFGDESEAESYREFKQGRKRHLVVCLDGTQPDDLPHLFLSALQKALRNEPETAKASLPFWTEEALRIVQRIESRDAERGRANEFLRSLNLDVANLKARLESQDVSVYDTVRSLCQHLSGFMPDMGGQVSLARAVEWAADTFCGEGDDKPFSGVLVLFDEFSAFMRSYSIRGTAGNPLQKLLDGVSNRQGKAAFVAFGQSDPDATVHSVFHQTPNEQGRASLLLELQRLPARFRFQLYTTMESVLDSYLDQDSKLRGAFDRDSVWPAILDATDDCLTLFRRRYEQELGWNSERFQEVVTLGAFPLHPTTTALLCNVELLESTSPRSVLGFVFKQLERLADQPVTAGGSPCWVRAVHLVDWFQGQLADDEWKQYEEALRQRGGDLAPHEGLVLKAMLLHVVSKMPTQQVRFAHALVYLTGLTQAEVEGALKQLADATVIEHVPTANKYSFWPLGGGARLLHDRINREIGGRSMKWDEWKKANASAAEFGLPAIAVPVDWGHPNDWEARQWYLPREFASATRVREVVSDSPGCVIWLVARNDADVDWFDQNGEQILSALGNTAPLPVAVMCPSRPSSLLLEGMFKHVVLESLTGTEIVQFGSGIVQTVKTQVKSTIVNETRLLATTKKRYGVPLPYAASLKAARPPDRTEAIVQRLYELAYPSAPPAFFTQYKARSANLKSAVSHLSALLLRNQVNSDTYLANKVAVGTVDNFLVVGKQGAWGVLSPDKKLQLPQHQRTTTGWDLLSQSIPPNGTEAEIRPAVLQLRQPPFGYDDNTLTLLFCAWYGYYRHDLRLSIKGAINTVEFLAEKVKAGPGDLVEFLSAGGVSLSRKDRAGTVGEVKKIIERAALLAAEPMSKTEASAATVKLTEFLNDERNQDPSERGNAEDAGRIIGDGLKRADAYDSEVRSILEAAHEQGEFTKLLDLAKRVGKVESVRGVVPEQPPVSDVREAVLKRLGESVDAFCKQNEALSDITHYKHQYDQLTDAGRAVHTHVDLHTRIRQALERLGTAKVEYEGKQKDAALLGTLKVIGTRGPLQQLRGSLECVNGATCVSPEAQAVQAAKKADLKQAIEEHERFAADIGTKVDVIAAAGALAKVESSITERRWAFVDAPEMAQITAALDRCAALRRFFEDLDATGLDTFGTRKEHEACVKALQELKVNHAGCLSGPREALIVDAEEKAQSRVMALEKNAEAWLAKRQSCSNEAKDLNRLLDELSHPPDFLPAARATEVQGLVSKLRELISKDAYGQIRALFLQIRDKDLRKRLIEELRTLLTTDGE